MCVCGGGVEWPSMEGKNREKSLILVTLGKKVLVSPNILSYCIKKKRVAWAILDKRALRGNIGSKPSLTYCSVCLLAPKLATSYDSCQELQMVYDIPLKPS